MPELPEVETVARQLNALIADRRIRAVEILDKKLRFPSATLLGMRIKGVHRQGKLVVLDLCPKNGTDKLAHLAIHLRMTGRLIWEAGTKEKSRQATGKGQMFVHTVETERKHLRAAFHLDGGTVCFFDPRRFGTIELFNSRADMPTMGVDPTESTFTQAQLSALLSGRKQPLKLWLLRQDAICGIGNIYASEILFRAKLSPFRLASRVKPKEVSLLYRSIRRVLAEAIERCGTTFSDFQDSNGEVGGFGAFLRVYDREGLKCRVCREEEILRHTQSQRSTYYCPSCQR